MVTKLLLANQETVIYTLASPSELVSTIDPDCYESAEGLFNRLCVNHKSIMLPRHIAEGAENDGLTKKWYEFRFTVVWVNDMVFLKDKVFDEITLAEKV